MGFVEATWPVVQSAMDCVRAGCRGRALTNCFTSFRHIDRISCIATDQAVAFLIPEEGFSRLYFQAVDAHSLELLLPECQGRGVLVIGYVDRSRNDLLCAAFERNNFRQIAQYSRLVHDDFALPPHAVPPEYAMLHEADHLMGMLRAAFDPFTDHLPSPADLRQRIAEQQVIVRRQEGSVTGFVVFHMTGHLVHFNYLLNRGRPGDGLLLLHSFFRCMVERGVSRGFLWVNSANVRAQHIYLSNGWRPDGLSDWFFLRQPT